MIFIVKERTILEHILWKLKIISQFIIIFLLDFPFLPLQINFNLDLFFIFFNS